MRTIHNKLKNLEGYLVSIERDPDMGVYTIKVGLPSGWVYRETETIKCEVLNSSDEGKLILIKPVDDSIVIDDLFRFFDKLIEVNHTILRREEEFQKEMEQIKQLLETKKDEFYQEIDELGDISFSELEKEKIEEVVEEDVVKDVVDEPAKEKKGAPKKTTTTKKETTTKKTTTTKDK